MNVRQILGILLLAVLAGAGGFMVASMAAFAARRERGALAAMPRTRAWVWRAKSSSA